MLGSQPPDPLETISAVCEFPSGGGFCHSNRKGRRHNPKQEVRERDGVSSQPGVCSSVGGQASSCRALRECSETFRGAQQRVKKP